MRSVEFPKLLFNDYKDSLWPKTYLQKLKKNAKDHGKKLETTDTSLRKSNQCLTLALLFLDILKYSIEENEEGVKIVYIHVNTIKSNNRFCAPWESPKWEGQMRNLYVTHI